MVATCLQPGASVAALALSHGMNANVVHALFIERFDHQLENGRVLRIRPECGMK